MDFYKIRTRPTKKGVMEVYPDFIVGRSKDLMIRGKSFYAVWDEEIGLWCTDEFKVASLVDKDIYHEVNELESKGVDAKLIPKTLTDFSTSEWDIFKRYISKLPDNMHQLDNKIAFSNTEVKKSDYISRRLNYPLEEGDISAYDEIMSTLYDPAEREKLEWAIGSIIFGDSKKIQKFIVLYGDAGAGKSTVLNIIQMLFDGYYTTFDAKELASTNSSFATDAFSNDPLVAIQHDGDLSGIKDNSKLNSIISHEEIIVNEKFKARYSTRANCFLFMATNKPVKITDGKSGLIRRLIDVKPSGRKLIFERYNELMEKVPFELGAIANHCLKRYLEMGKSYYNSYKPLEMMYKTDPFFNFVEDSYFIFSKQEGVTLKQAYSLYKEYCKESGAEYQLQMYKFREELKNYFKEFREEATLEDGTRVRSYFTGFIEKKFKNNEPVKKPTIKKPGIIFKEQHSLFDDICKECPAQYASNEETPQYKWLNVKTTLNDIDTHKLHYVKVPEDHIVIDFDLKDKDGNKCLELNLEAASKWPKTYAELSKGGQGIHLHYIYTGGDPKLLSRIYDDNIEIKVYTGNSSLRRKLSMCNDIPIATISSGLPLKAKGEAMVNFEVVKSEKSVRNLIKKNLAKDIHPATKPSIDFIFKILEDAYASGMHYDVTDMRPAILAFAANSSNQSEYCIKLVNQMKFKSEEYNQDSGNYGDADIVFYDVEVFPNLFLINWKKIGEGNQIVRMINPTPPEVESLLRFRLVGFNCRRYDNHILYARMMGYSNEQLFKLSQRIVSGSSSNCFFGEAYNISYADIYDFSSVKQSLKKFEIELGIHHQELGLPWDQPVPEELWEKVAEYCDNDVIATEAVWFARQQDFVARQILADISGLTVNDTTRMHTTKIIFGDEKHPDLVYTDLSEMFPGYSYENGHSSYRGEDPGEGGYVYSEPGMYGNVALLDIASMHPSSIIALNLFGEYTGKFKDILDARLYIKHKEFDKAGQLLNGAFAPYLKDPSVAKDLAQALKIVINSVYGFTTATFDNPFKDPRNVDNIVAKRGALFMINLKHEVQERGFRVAHIKTDSIKIPDATPEIISFVMEYGKKYGYNFEHEATYDRLCLVNDAVYIAKDKSDNHWTATGTQFQVPYVFKKLFSKEEIIFEDMCETKSVSSQLYLDMNEGKEEHDYQFIGKVGQFCPILPGKGGGELFREKDGKYYAATGTKGYRWLESEMVKTLGKQNDIDKSYYDKLCNDAVDTISKYGDFEWFVSDDPYISPPFPGGTIQ